RRWVCRLARNVSSFCPTVERMGFVRRIRLRTLGVGLFLSFLFLILLVKIFMLQVVDAAWLQEKATHIWNRNEILRPERGKLYDRNGDALAYDAPAYTVVATLSKKDPNHVKDAAQTASQLARV